MPTQSTMLDLVTALTRSGRPEGEVVAMVMHLVNSDTVRLCGNFRGARFGGETLPTLPPVAAL